MLVCVFMQNLNCFRINKKVNLVWIFFPRRHERTNQVSEWKSKTINDTCHLCLQDITNLKMLHYATRGKTLCLRDKLCLKKISWIKLKLQWWQLILIDTTIQLLRICTSLPIRKTQSSNVGEGKTFCIPNSLMSIIKSASMDIPSQAFCLLLCTEQCDFFACPNTTIKKHESYDSVVWWWIL